MEIDAVYTNGIKQEEKITELHDQISKLKGEITLLKTLVEEKATS